MLDVRDKANGKQKKTRRIIAVCAIVLCLLVELLGRVPGLAFDGWDDVFAWVGLPRACVIEEDELQVHFIDVGNADCILVRQDDHNLLIDAGENNRADFILEYLSRHNVDELDLVIATHPHTDHIGSMTAIIRQIPIKRFVLSYMPEEETPTTYTYTSMLEELEKRDVPIDVATAGNTYDLGTAQVQVLAPQPLKDPIEDANQISVVTRLTFGENAFLFTGDAEVDLEERMLANDCPLQADVLKVAHHGSKASTSPAFLRAVSPQYAVISCGPNDYSHPSDEVVLRLMEAGAAIYRTDRYGDIVFASDGHRLSVKTEKDVSAYVK